jgi:hypothetical protein
VCEDGIQVGLDLDRFGAFAQYDGETLFEIVSLRD